MNIVRLVLPLLLAAFLAFMSFQKFIGPNPVFSYIALTSGMDIFEPIVRMATGVAEALAAVLLLMPRTRMLGALAALGVIAGAIGFHLSPWLGISAPVAFAEGAAAPFDIATDFEKSPMLFMMAVGFGVVSLVVLMLSRRHGSSAESQAV